MQQEWVARVGEGTDILREDRVRRHTAAHVNAKIDTLRKAGIEQTIARGHDAIVARLNELDHEWDVDRALMAGFAIAGGISRELGERHPAGKYVHRAQMAFLLLHAVVGWCPPLVLLRRLGFRTTNEIDAERYALLERLRAA